MYRFLDVLLIDQDPAVIMAAHLKMSGNKYEQALCKTIQKIAICHTSNNKFPIPECPELFQIPFVETEISKNEDIVSRLTESCIYWYETIEKTINDLPTMESLKETSPIELPKEQINYWRKRQEDLIQLIDDFTFPAFERAVRIMEAAQVKEILTLQEWMTKTSEFLEEADDHVRFLGTIESSLEVIASTDNFDQISETIPGVANSLRNIWLLSKCFNTDAKIHNLILMISQLINERVVDAIQLVEFKNPDNLQIILKDCVTVLERWKKSFLKTRMDIEQSRKEKRWEFDINLIFADTDHINTICKDMILICRILMEIKNCFAEEMKQITTKPKFLQSAIEKIECTTQGLYEMKFKPFDKNTKHHWATLMSWFQREVLFLEAESGKIIEETFDSLIRSDLAVNSLKQLKSRNLREVIGKKYMKKVDCVILKFSKEIDAADELFETKCDDPPVEENLPPISGSIYWSQGIGAGLKSTLEQLTSLEEIVQFETWPDVKVKLDKVLKKMENYEVGKYTDWRNKVSDILDQNLGKNLIKREDEVNGVGKFIVNFTSDLSDTFAEVINMEKIGFKVPEVAKNMSMQEAKLLDIADQLQKMLDHYHEVVGSVEGAELELLLDDLKETEVALRPGFIRLTWNSLGINDYIIQSDIHVCRTESVIRQIHTIKNSIQKKVDKISTCKVFDKFKNPADGKQKNFRDFHHDIMENQKTNIDILVCEYEEISPLLMKVEEILVKSRTKMHKRLESYYSYWESQVYQAVINFIKINLDDLLEIMNSKIPLFKVEVILDGVNVAISPSEPMILKGVVTIIKYLLEGSKEFIRWCRGSCISVHEVRVKGEIKPVQPSFYDDIIRLPDIIEKVGLVQESIVKTLEEVQSYLGSWKFYKNLWKFNKKETCEKFLERNPSCVDFDEKLLYYSLLERQIKEREQQKVFQCLESYLGPIKKTLLLETQEWIECLGKLLEQTAKQELQTLMISLEGLENCLIYPKNGEELENVLQAISTIWGMSLSVEITYREIEERYRTLQMYGLKIEKSQVESAKFLPSRWESIFKRSKEVHFRVTPLKEKYTEITKMQILKFLKEVDTLETKFYDSGPGSVGSALDEGLLLLRHFKTQLAETVEKGEGLNKQEKLYVLPVTQFTILHTLAAEMETLNEIYEAYQTYLDFEERWKALTWRKLDLDLIAKEVVSVEEVLQTLKAKHEKAQTLDEIVRRKDKSKKLFSVLRKLKESKLRPRHWRDICTAANITRDKDDDFDILNIWNVDLDMFGGKVHSVINLASNERTIEGDLQEIKELWEATKFSINRISWIEGGEKFFCLGDVTKILDHLLGHDNMLDAMAKSEYSTHFSKEISYWKRTLSKIGDVTQEWITVQDKWKDLSKAFAIKGFKDSLENGQGFEDLNKRYVRIMTETTKKPTVKDSCLVEDRYDSLVSLKEELDVFQDQLSKALELKRKQFPRFFFLSDHELITVLGGSIRDPLVQRLVKKLFKNVAPFIPDELGILEVIYTNDQEDLPLCKPVNTTIHPIEIWLSELLEESKVSTKLLLRWAHKDCDLQSPNFLRTISKFANILIIASFEMVWTEIFQNTLEKGKDTHPNNVMEDWKKLYKMTLSLFEQLSETNKSHLTNAEKRKNNLLLVLLLSKRDLIQNFLRIYVHSTSDFNWEKLLKYIWSTESGHVQIEQCFSIIDYGYEFMGVDSIGIQNPESEKVWFQINEAIRNHNIPQLSGAPGTGKSMIIGDLASRLAKCCFDIHLNENFTMDVMTQFLRGVCESNMWGNMENINLLKVSIMSVISSHFQTIKTAQTIHLREFTLDNQITRMYPGVAFLCTENIVEGAAYLKKIPLSLRTLFRKTSVQLPDMPNLLCSILRVHGFKKPVTMSRNLVRAVNNVHKIIATEKCNKAHFFKHIIQKAVNMLLENEEAQEGLVFYSVLLEYFEFLLPADEFQLTKTFLQQVYEIEDPITEIVVPTPNMDEKFDELGIIPNEHQAKIAFQITNSLKISNSVIVLGPVAGGKTSTISLSHRVYAEKNPSKMHFLNFSTYNEKEVLGDVQSEGIISNLLNESDEQVLFHIDGYFPESLAFPLTLLVDQNQYMNGGGKKQVPKHQTKFVIETNNLEEICESFITRSVIIDMKEGESFISNLIVENRLKKVEDPVIQEQLMDVFQKLQETIDPSDVSSVDKFLNRTKRIMITEMMDIFESINTKSEYPHEYLNFFVYSFFWAFSSCCSNVSKQKMQAAIKDHVEANKDSFENCNVHSFQMTNLIPMHNPLSEDRASWTEQTLKETLVKLSVNLLKNCVPVLIIGERFGQDVYEEIQRNIGSTVPTTQIFNYELHALSSSETIIDNLSKKLQKRGKSTLVPKESREILVSISDLSTSVNQSFDMATSLIKDLLEPKKLFFNNHGYDVKDVNLLCRLSPKGGVFKNSRILKNFVCVYAEDNFEDSVDAFKVKLKESLDSSIHGVIDKVGNAAKNLLDSSKKSYSSLSMVITTDIIMDILVSISKLNFSSGNDLLKEFCRRLHQSLISPAIDYSQQKIVQSWLTSSLLDSQIDFELSYDIELSEDLFPADINPTKQQYQQCKEVVHFLNNDQKFVSLYGNYGYGKTIVLNVATDVAGYTIDEVKNLDELRASVSKTSEKNLIMLRDTYIERDNMKGWLQAITSDENKHKVAFLMSPKSDNLIPWQQWILSKTQVVGIPFWNDESLISVVEETTFSNQVKEILTAIHKMMVSFCQNNELNHEKVSITSCHFVELLSRVDESVEKKINSNKLKVEDLKSIVKCMKSCKQNIEKYQKDLDGTNTFLNNYKDELKNIKKNVKLFNDDLENLSKEVDSEEKVNSSLKTTVNKLQEKYEEIKTGSFDDHCTAIELIKSLSPEEKIAFAKPLIVHEDVEKICTILMILLKMDVFGWKPFKDKFLSDDWPNKLLNLSPDNCKHKQVFIINKKLKEIKTAKPDLKNLSPIAGIFWDFIEGVLKAFTTEFERSKLSNEIEKVQSNLDKSHLKLDSLKKEEEMKKLQIKQQNEAFEEKTKACDKKEKETTELQGVLKHEQDFISTSAFFLLDCEKQIDDLQVDEKAALQEAIVQETVGTYFGAFNTCQREELLKSTKEIVNKLSERDISDVEFLQNFDLLAIDSDLTDNMSNLTQKRLLFCQDPNDLVALSLEREGESSKKSIKLYDESDIDKVKAYLKDEDCSCILIEDAYFENKIIMNKLLDDNLYELSLQAEQNDKFIFIITKVDDFYLPHKAYSKMYFINLNLSYSEVIRLMTSQFNKHIKKEEDARLTELLDNEEMLEEEITELQEIVVSHILKRNDVNEDESELLEYLSNLEKKTNEMDDTKTEIKSILYTINFEKSVLTKSATPIIVSLYLLSKMGLCAKPSFHNFCEATKRLYDDLEDKDNLMFQIYTMFSFQILESIRSLMASLMSMVHLAMNNDIPEMHIETFLLISKEISGTLTESDALDTDKPGWIKPKLWDIIVRHSLSELVLSNEEAWREWNEDHSKVVKNEKPFYSLLISMVLDSKRASQHLVNFVQLIIGFEYLKADTIIVADVHSFSTPNDPIVFLLGSSVEEPSSDLTRLADLQGIASSKVKYLALANENVPLAMDLLETAFIRGQWLIFQNVDLVPNFLPKLDKRIQEKDPEDVHEDFRVWMTWTNGHLPTFSLLQRAIVLSCEPCRDIRYHNSNFLYNIPLKIVKQQEFYQSIIFYTLGYLQKVFACRQKFSALSWSDNPEFPNYLMQTAYQFCSQYFNVTQDSIKKIQYKQLLDWTKQFLYYNHMTHPVDQGIISMYLDEYIGQFLFEEHNPFKSSFTSRDALEEVITEKTEELKNIPKITSQMLMLSPAADRLFQIKMSHQTVSHIRRYFELQTSLQAAETTELLQKLIKILEKPKSYEEFNITALTRWKVIKFEIEHVKKVAEKILEEINRIDLCLLEGFWPSPETLSVLNFILKQLTPPSWR